MESDKAYILNPDYHFRNDTDRLVMYSKTVEGGISSDGWLSYVHPDLARLLCLFTDERPFGEHLSEIASHLRQPEESVKRILEQLVENPEPADISFSGGISRFPKNVLIGLAEDSAPAAYDFTAADLQTARPVDLTPDRTHRSPQYMLYMINNRCVTRCAYCYADKTTRCTEMTTPQVLRMIEEAARLKMSYIDVIGGELFCRNDWDVILASMVDHGLMPTFISTKVPVTRDIVSRLKATGYNKVVQLSLDSVDDAVCRRIIASPDGYVSSVLDGIRLLEDHGFKIQVDTVLTKWNCGIADIAAMHEEVARMKNLVYWEIRVPGASIYNRETFRASQAPRKALEELRTYVRETLMPSSPVKIIFSGEPLDERFRCTPLSEPCFEGGSCGILTSRMFVLPDGKVSCCEQLYWHPHFIIGDLTRQTIEEVWNSDRAKELFASRPDGIRESSACHDCQKRDWCHQTKRKCWMKVIKAYGSDNVDYPDPRCVMAPQVGPELTYE